MWWCPDDPHGFSVKPYDVTAGALSGTNGKIVYDGSGYITNKGSKDYHFKYKDERWNSTKWADIDFVLRAGETIRFLEARPTADLLDHIVECPVVDSSDDRVCDATAKDPTGPRTFDQTYNDRHVTIDGDRTHIKYLSNDPDELADAINEMHLYDGTGTQIAMRWGMLLLDPAFQKTFSDTLANGVVPNKKPDGTDIRPSSFSSRPAAFDDKATTKYLVLMTDGNFTEQYGLKNNETLYYHEKAGAGNGVQQQTLVSKNKAGDLFTKMCNLAKANAVTVYTIGFALKDGDSVKKKLADCASSSSHYFDVTDGDLKSAFDKIAASIQKLKLTS